MNKKPTIILFVTSVFDTPNTGPATYARLLHQYFGDSAYAFKVITSDTNQTDSNIISIKKTIVPAFVYLKLWLRTKAEAAKYKDKMVIVHYNNSFPYLFFGKLGNMSIIQLNDYYNIVTPYVQLRITSARHIVSHVLRKFTEYFSIKRADIIISNSIYTTEQVLQRYHTDPRVLRTIHKSLNLQQLKIRPAGPHKGSVLYIGNNIKLKGFDVLVEALTSCNHVKELHIAGPSASSPAVIHLLERIPKHIKIMQYGALKQEQLYDLMIQSDLVVIPARFEALGVAVIESLAQSIPTLTTGVGGLKEVLVDYPSIFSDPQNVQPQHLAQNIEQVFSHYEEFYNITFEKMADIRRRFNPDNMMRAIENIYRLEE